MRSSSARILFGCFITIATMNAGATPLEARFDRVAARELARVAVGTGAPVLAARMRPTGRVETLAQPIAVPATEHAAKIVVEGASSLRLYVRGATAGTVLWVAGEEDETFERFEPGPDPTWTPTTRGSVVYIASENGGVAMTVSQLAFEAERPSSNGAQCLRDAACATGEALPELAEASRAIAMIRFVRGDASYVCTGSLLADRSGSETPYFLTARHCISTPEEAASIEAVWDERADVCGATPRNRSTRTYGAELLVSSAATDMALLRLKKIPADRVFLGVSLAPLMDGERAYRLSHADGAPLTYASGVVRTTGGGCGAAPRPEFLYSSPTSGTVTSGSSGAPLLLPGLRVAGQLLGVCGPSPEDACAAANDSVDGSIAASWPLLAPYLDQPAASTRRRAAR